MQVADEIETQTLPDGQQVVRLVTSLATEKQSWKPGQKYICSPREAQAKLAAGEAIPAAASEPDWIAPEGWNGPHGKTSTATAANSAVLPPAPATSAPSAPITLPKHKSVRA